MLDAVSGCPFRLDRGQLAKVIPKAVGRAPIEAGPKGRFADRDAAHPGERGVVIGDARHHVDVGVDVVHDSGGWGARG